MYKTKFILIIALAVCLIFVACGDDDEKSTTPTTNDAPFTFLKVGNEWEYGLYDYNTGELRQTMKMKIVSENNGYYKVIPGDEDNYYEDRYNYYFVNDNGWYISSEESETDAAIRIPQNCYVGLKYDYSYSVRTMLTAEIISVSEEVIVPAGTISNCIKIKLYSPDDVDKFEYVYYHKDIGIVIDPATGKGPLKLHSKNFE